MRYDDMDTWEKGALAQHVLVHILGEAGYNPEFAWMESKTSPTDIRAGGLHIDAKWSRDRHTLSVGRHTVMQHLEHDPDILYVNQYGKAVRCSVLPSRPGVTLMDDTPSPYFVVRGLSLNLSDLLPLCSFD